MDGAKDWATGQRTVIVERVITLEFPSDVPDATCAEAAARIVAGIDRHIRRAMYDAETRFSMLGIRVTNKRGEDNAGE